MKTEEIKELTDAIKRFLVKIEGDATFESIHNVADLISWLEGQLFNKIVAAYDEENALAEELLYKYRTIKEFFSECCNKNKAVGVDSIIEIRKIVIWLNKFDAEEIENNEVCKVKTYEPEIER